MHAGARVYRDLVGIAHQRIAAQADEVDLLVAGLPIRLKGPSRVTGGPPITEEAAADQRALDRVLDAIGPLDTAAMAEAAARLDRLTKPPGSLGRLETVVIELAGITGRTDATVERGGRSSSPPRTTVSCARACRPTRRTSPPRWSPTSWPAGPRSTSSAAGPVSAWWSSTRASPRRSLTVSADPVRGGRLVRARIRDGTADMTAGPAMTRAEALRAVGDRHRPRRRAVGRRPRPPRRRRDGDRQHDGGERHLRGPDRAAGRARHRPRDRHRRRDPPAQDRGHRTRARGQRPGSTRPDRRPGGVGGLEIALLVGVIVGAAEARIPVVLDGFITGAAALVAAALQPAIAPRLIAAHRSIEPGHAVILEHLGRRPLLDLDLRLGEGTGAALAMGLIAAAVRLRDGMATFESAAISGPTAEAPGESEPA